MNILEYIKGNELLASMDLLTVYTTIAVLIDDGYILLNPDTRTEVRKRDAVQPL